MTIQVFFPFTPHYTTWEDWNGNLIQFYSEEPIAYNSEEDWKETAKIIAGLPTFLAYPVSNPDLFETWQSWAEDFTTIVNGRSI
jgi:hypothetical protein